MKKLISILMAAAIALSLSLTAVAADALKSVGSYSSVSARYYYNPVKLTYLSKSFKMSKNRLEVKDDELLLVPKGVKLYLYKGAEIKGSIYVANGGYLYIKDGDVDICDGGAIYSEGYVAVSSKSKLTLDRNSELFINKGGKLRLYSDASYNTDSMGDIICLGSTNSAINAINKKAIAAYVSNESGTTKSDDPVSLLPTSDNFDCPMGDIDWGERQRIVFIFDKGACLKTDMRKGASRSYKFKFVGNTCVGAVGSFVDSGDGFEKVNEITTIGGSDYTADVTCSGGIIKLTDDLKTIEYTKTDNRLADEALSDLSKHKYLGKSKTNLPIYLGTTAADLYLTDNGYVLAVAKLGTGNNYSGYSDATEEELKQVYEYAFYRPV